MHTLTTRTGFKFGDRVRFDSRSQECSGEGKVFAITVDDNGLIDYMIEIDRGWYSDLEPGILEDEMALLEAGGPSPQRAERCSGMHTLTFRTRFTFGNRVRFDSRRQRCSGEGKVYAITFDGSGQIGYMIEFDRDRHIQPGILEDEITLLETGGQSS